MSSDHDVPTKRRRSIKFERLERKIQTQQDEIKQLRQQLQTQENELDQLRWDKRYMGNLVTQFLDAFGKLQQLAKSEVADIKNFPGDVTRRFRPILLLFTGLCPALYTLYS